MKQFNNKEDSCENLIVNETLTYPNPGISQTHYEDLKSYLTMLLVYQFESRCANIKSLNHRNPFLDFQKNLYVYNTALEFLQKGYNVVIYPVLLGNHSVLVNTWNKLSSPFSLINPDENTISFDLLVTQAKKVGGSFGLNDATYHNFYFHGDEMPSPLNNSHMVSKVSNTLFESLEQFLSFYGNLKHLYVSKAYLQNLLHKTYLMRPHLKCFNRFIPRVYPNLSFNFDSICIYNRIVYEHLDFNRNSPFSVYSQTVIRPIPFITKLMGKLLRTDQSFTDIMSMDQFNCFPSYRKLCFMPIEPFLLKKLKFAPQYILQDYSDSTIFSEFIIKSSKVITVDKDIKFPPAPRYHINFFTDDEVFKFMRFNALKPQDAPKIKKRRLGHVSPDGTVTEIIDVETASFSNCLITDTMSIEILGVEMTMFHGRVTTELFFSKEFQEKLLELNDKLFKQISFCSDDTMEVNSTKHVDTIPKQYDDLPELEDRDPTK